MNVVEKYFGDLTPHQISQFESLPQLYELWNAQINVISRKDIDHLLEKHVLHSLAIYKFIRFLPGSRILDIGTGGGFPGIPLAIVCPDVQFMLTDSIGKKIKVVQAVAEALNLKNVTALHERAEKIPGKFDFIISRAVADLSELTLWSKGKIATKQINALPNGLICLKGGDLEDETSGFGKRVQIFNLSEYFQEEFFETKKLVYLPFQ